MVVQRIRNTIGNIFKKEFFMDQDQLKRMSAHRYMADDQSILTVYVSTFLGLVREMVPFMVGTKCDHLRWNEINLAATLLLASYSPDCAHFAPKWVYLQCALALFIYQTLDSTDGKQARRTNTSSPLGELFDHGCDALMQIFLALQVSISMSLGDTHWGTIQFWLVAMYMFYAAHWQTYATGVLKFGKFDIVESQCVIITILLTSGIFGPEVWFKEVFGITMRRWFLTPCAFVAVYVSSVVLFTIYTQGAGKNGRTVANTSVSTAIIPIMSYLIPSILVYWKSITGIYDQHIVLYCVAFGLVAVKVISKVILAHMSRSPLVLYDTINLGPLVVVINQYFGNVISEYYMLWICLIYGAVNLAYYAYMVCRQICDYMKIDCFHIPYPNPKKEESIANGSMTNGVAANGTANGYSYHH